MLFQALAIAVLTVFYACYLGKMLLQKRAGIQTDQMGKGKSGTSGKIEIVMKAVTYLTVFAELFCIALNRNTFPTPVRTVGFLLGAVGDGFFFSAVLTMKDNWRAGVSPYEKTDLVTNGVFQVSRNPAFLGFDLVYIGIVCMFFSWPLFALSILSCVMLHVQIVKNEEPFLEKTFGEDYMSYKNRVNRYIGRK